MARGLLERSLALDASLAEAASSLADLENQRGRSAEAELLHRKAIEINAKSAPIRNNYASFLHRQGAFLQSRYGIGRFSETGADPRKHTAPQRTIPTLEAAALSTVLFGVASRRLERERGGVSKLHLGDAQSEGVPVKAH